VPRRPLDDEVDDAARRGPAGDEDDVDGEEVDELRAAGIDPAEAEALAREVAAIRRQLLEVPANQVVANHAMGLFELAAIHLNQPEPDLLEAALAIDAMGVLVEGLEGRLGEAEPTLRDALAQIRLAFVQLRGAQEG
jgi:hypothetical protein